MKIRTDFVTNSSSSSFIVAFKNKAELEKGKAYVTDKYGEAVAERIFSDILLNKRTKKDIMAELLDHLYWEQLYYCQNGQGCYLTAEAYQLKYGITMQEKARIEAKKKLKELEGKMPSRCMYYAELEYSDHSSEGAELEKRICPNLPFVYKVISNH